MSDNNSENDSQQLNELPEPSVKFTTIPETLEKSYQELFPTFPNGLMKSEIDGFVCNPYMAENFKKIYRIKLRSDDIWVRTFPRSGTTWVSELAWLIVNDLNFEEAARTPLTIRSPNIDGNYLNDWGAMAPPETEGFFVRADKIDEMPTSKPRVLKTHMPSYMLPPGLLDTCKTVYVARNPKDAIVSFYYLMKLVKISQFDGDFEQFVDLFLRDLRTNEVGHRFFLSWTPYFTNVLNAWAVREHPNMHIIFYEDLKRDLKGSIKKLAEFLGKSLTEEQIQKITEYGKIDNFATNESVNYSAEIKAGMANEGYKFIRKGKTGDWKNHFSPELNKRVDEWIEKHLSGTGLQFVTELESQD